MKKIRFLLSILLAMILMASTAFAFDGLKKGDYSDDVYTLQLRLNALGYSVGAADGDYGGKTEKAVSDFQSDHGLDVTGETDEATWNALYDEHASISEKGFTFDVKLVPPFSFIVPDETETDIAWLVLSDPELDCETEVEMWDSAEEYSKYMQLYVENNLYGDAVENYGASNFQCESESSEINDYSAELFSATFDYLLDGRKVVRCLLLGCIEVDTIGSDKVLIVCSMAYSKSPEASSNVTLETIRDVLANVSLTDNILNASLAPSDPVIGDWYLEQNGSVIVMTINADGTYTADFDDGFAPAQGTWKAEGNGYLLDNGPLVMTLEGDYLTIGEGESADRYQREPIEKPELPVNSNASETDYFGTWKATGVYFCNDKGIYDESSENLLGSDIQVTVSSGELIMSGMTKEDEHYAVVFDNAGLSNMTTAEGGLFEDGCMQLLDDGTSIIYVPGQEYMCIVLERQ